MCAVVAAVGGVAAKAQAGSDGANRCMRSTARPATTRWARRIPAREALAKMSPARILRTLDFGLMMSIAYPMRRDEREAVARVSRHGNRRLGSATQRILQGRPADHVRFFSRRVDRMGASPANTRFQAGDRAGINSRNVGRLQLKWAFGFAGDVIAFAAPTVLNGTLFVGSAGGAVQALDARNRLSALAIPGKRSRAHGDDGRRRGQQAHARVQRPERAGLCARCPHRQGALEETD